MSFEKIEKEKRSPTFSSIEENILLDLIEKYSSIIENKQSDATLWKQKQETWLKILDEFEMRTGIKRLVGNIKFKYDNMKKKAKRELTEERLDTRLYGGKLTKRISATTERILEIVKDMRNTFEIDAACEEKKISFLMAGDKVELEVPVKTEDPLELEEMEMLLEENKNKESSPPTSDNCEMVKKKTEISSLMAGDKVELEVPLKTEDFLELEEMEMLLEEHKNMESTPPTSDNWEMLNWPDWNTRSLKISQCNKLKRKISSNQDKPQKDVHYMSKKKELLSAQEQFFLNEEKRAAEKHMWEKNRFINEKEDREFEKEQRGWKRELHNLEKEEKELNIELLRIQVECKKKLLSSINF